MPKPRQKRFRDETALAVSAKSMERFPRQSQMSASCFPVCRSRQTPGAQLPPLPFSPFYRVFPIRPISPIPPFVRNLRSQLGDTTLASQAAWDGWDGPGRSWDGCKSENRPCLPALGRWYGCTHPKPPLPPSPRVQSSKFKVQGSKFAFSVFLLVLVSVSLLLRLTAVFSRGIRPQAKSAFTWLRS